MIDFAFVVMSFGDLLGMSWDILEFVVTRIWLVCLAIFAVIMIKTMLDLSKKILRLAGPGIRKLLPTTRRR